MKLRKDLIFCCEPQLGLGMGKRLGIHFQLIAIILGLILFAGSISGSASIAFADDDDDDRKKRLIELIAKIRSHLEDDDDKCPEEKKYEGICDNKRPKIEIKEPDKKDKLPAGLVTFELKAKDKGSGLAKVELRINDGPFLDATLISGDKWEFVADLEPGKYKATAKATDKVGNMKRDNVKFTVVDVEEEEEEEEKAKIKAELELEQGDSVDVEVKVKGLKPNETFVVRAYSSTDCAAGTILGGSAVGSDTSDDKGKIEISGTVSSVDVDDVNSVSIRDTPSLGQIVVCFQDTTPEEEEEEENDD